MKPLVAIVGRPNVGKSTLFNRIIGEKRAIVLDTPGVTRDRHYGDASWDGAEFTVIDTGGFEPEADSGVTASMRHQALAAIDQAEVVVFVMDGQDGLLPADREVAELLRRTDHDVIFAVNKVDTARHQGMAAEFYELGVETLLPVSAEHGRGVGKLLDEIVDRLPPYDEDPDDERTTRVAFVGRPNVGKSTLTNRLLGDERMIVDEVAGTTRDAIDSAFVHNDADYTLIDTAGLRRARGINRKSSEGFSVMRTIRAIERCHVAVLLLDATEGATDQDARIAGLAHDKGRALVIAINKWDLIEKDAKTAKAFADQIRLKMPFCSYAPVLFMSGLTGQRTHKLMGLVEQVRAAHQTRVPTAQLNRWLELAVRNHQPPVVKGRRLRFYYATQARVAPPTIVLSCNDPEVVHFSYQRYLVNQFRESFKMDGTPVRLVFKGKKNPFVDEED